MRFGRRALLFGLIVFAGAIASPLARADEQYAIHMNRRVTVGQVYRIDADFSVREEESIPGVAARVKLTHVHLKGTDEIVAINRMGREITGKITVEQFQYTVEGAAQTPLAKGSVITLSSKDGSSLADVEGKSLDEKLANRLWRMLQLSTTSQAYGEQQYLGTQEPQSVSGKWPINSEMAANRFGANSKLQTSEVTGESQLTEVGDIEGVPFLTIVSKVKLARWPDYGSLPPGTTLNSSHENFTLSEQMSVKHQSPPVNRSEEYDEVAVLNMNSPATGKVVNVTVSFQTRMSCHRELMKPS